MKRPREATQRGFSRCGSEAFSNIPNMNSATLTDSAEDLRKRLHEEIDREDPQSLEAIWRIVLFGKILRGVEKLNQDFDADEAAGRLDPALVNQAIREFRAARKRA
jgi:hypothetical protein